MKESDLKPGDVTTLGNLRPGDVGVFHGIDGNPFVIAVPGRGEWADGSRQWFSPEIPVIYRGRGKVAPAVPARIVMEGEPDRVAEMEAKVRTLREAVVVERKELERRTKCPEQFEKFPCCSHHECHAIARIRAALAATAPKGEK